jgi:hypothetical protein
VLILGWEYGRYPLKNNPMNQTTTIDSPQICKLCGGSFTVRSILENAHAYWPALNVTLAQSPCCQVQEELQIQTQKIIRGYVYAAEAPHFCAMEEYEVPDLEWECRDNSLIFKLNQVEYVIKLVA